MGVWLKRIAIAVIIWLILGLYAYYYSASGFGSSAIGKTFADSVSVPIAKGKALAAWFFLPAKSEGFDPIGRNVYDPAAADFAASCAANEAAASAAATAEAEALNLMGWEMGPASTGALPRTTNVLALGESLGLQNAGALGPGSPYFVGLDDLSAHRYYRDLTAAKKVAAAKSHLNSTVGAKTAAMASMSDYDTGFQTEASPVIA